jgi:hypothetical protein
VLVDLFIDFGLMGVSSLLMLNGIGLRVEKLASFCP